MNPPDRSPGNRGAHDRLQEFGPRLAADARSIVTAHPEANLAGLILEAGTPDYKKLRTFVQQTTGLEVVPPGFAGIVPLAVLAGIMAEAPQHVRDAFAEILEGDLDRIPVLACTENGMELAGFDLNPPSQNPGRPR
jgi:hypothetical protein